MNGKKVVNFLLFRSAISSRNLVSLGLVFFFFLVYVLAGGKIAAVPRGIRPDGSFGGARSDRSKFEVRGDVESSNNDGESARADDTSTSTRRGSLRSDSRPAEPQQAAATPAPAPAAGSGNDRLSNLEARLNGSKMGTNGDATDRK